MDFELSEEQQALQQTVREFARAEVAPHAERWDRERVFPIDVIRKLGALGVMGIPFPEAYGGLSAGPLAMAVVIEELARVDSSVAITVAASAGLGGMPLLLFGTEAQKQRWLVPLARGEILGAFASTEPGGGSDVQAAQTRAELLEGEWVIDGAKAFITNAGTEMSGFVILTAQTGERGRRELSTILVPAGTPGFQVGPSYRKMGWHASDTRELVFDNCRVPEEDLVGPRGHGARHFLAILDGGRIGVAALSVGLAQGALDLAIDYARQRTAFGRAIVSFQAIQFQLAQVAAEIEAARALTYAAAAMKAADRPCTKQAAMAKLIASELAVKAADVCVQVHGGLGYMDDTAAARYYRDANILTIGEGTSEIQRLVIARHLGLGV
ncbi:MAG: acyl-CoA dehydrogenase family protein [Chloroflexi bacterium]|nr:acyl-CoA dehydrogenase family protein [Chloroflexota bacterium]